METNLEDFLYNLKVINGKNYVQHTGSGCTIPYQKKRRKDPPMQEFKYEFFRLWLSMGSVPRNRWFERQQGKSIVMGKMKEMYQGTCASTIICDDVVECKTVSSNLNWYAPTRLAPFPCDTPQPACTPCAPCKVKPTKKAKAMYDDFEDDFTMTKTDETKKRDYLASRAYDVDHKHYQTIREQFNMDVDATPKTKDELARKLAAGEFTLADGAFDQKTGVMHRYIGLQNAIVWFDPAKKIDTAGFDAAEKAKAEKLTSTMDSIKVDTIDNALKALKDFEAWTPTGVAN